MTATTGINTDRMPSEGLQQQVFQEVKNMIRNLCDTHGYSYGKISKETGVCHIAVQLLYRETDYQPHTLGLQKTVAQVIYSDLVRLSKENRR